MWYFWISAGRSWKPPRMSRSLDSLPAAFFDETDVLDAHPAGPPQRSRRLAGDAARADDQRKRLVVAAAAQGADGRPGQTPARQHAEAGQGEEEQHRHARFVQVVPQKRRRQDQQGQQRRSLGDADDLFAQAAQAIDGVLAGEVIAADGEQQHERQVRPAMAEVDRLFRQRNPAGLEAQIPGADPGEAGQQQIAHEKPDGQDLAAAFNHREPHPWGEKCGRDLFAAAGLYLRNPAGRRAACSLAQV